MKHSFLKHILLWALAINTLPIAAYDYLKIYFKDGHTERHLMHLVESISTTKYDLEGNLHSDYQMQQIVMQDATYSYYIADIDSMTFKRAEDEQVKANVEAVSNNVVPIFEQCSSIDEMETHIDKIKAMECVEDVWREGTDIVVQIRDWKQVFFKYPLIPVIDESYYSEVSNSLARSDESQLPIKSDGTPLKVGIAFQMVDDSRFINEKVGLVKLKNKFKQMGFDAYYIEELDLNFFDQDMFVYDILFLATHGCYGGKHYLCTSIKTDILDDVKIRIKNMENDIDDVQYAFFQTEAWAIDSPIPTGSFLVLSENYIRNSQHKFTGPGPHIVFNAACSSLYGKDQLIRENDGEKYPGNDSMARVFFDKGADIYFGETNDSYYSIVAGFDLFLSMLQGASEERAFRSLDDKYKYETDSEDKAALLDLFNPNSEYAPLKSLFLNSVQTEERSEQEINNDYKSNGQIELKGIISPLTDINKGLYLGFRLAAEPIVDNITDYEDIKSNNAHFSGTKNGEVLFSSTMTPEPGQTYYYRAFTYDGINYNWGEERTFTIEDNNSNPYAVLATNGTLTFYCDNKRSSRKGNSYEISGAEVGWSSKYESIKKVVFDSSFANARPTSTANWFWGCSKLSSIVGIENLVTDNVTDMGAMFGECSSLTSIDVSGFKTDNVTNMGHMFGGCSRLTSIDVGGFETDNVTDMTGMFWGCSNLSSLDLSGFRTGNVTSMNGMFYDCSKLRSIYVSGRWSTRSVTEGYIMFTNCYKLVGGSGTTYDPDHVDYSYAHIDGGPGDPGYLTED